MARKYPCIFGLKDHCEARKLVEKQASKTRLEIRSPVLLPQPKTDEAQVAKRMAEVYLDSLKPFVNDIMRCISEASSPSVLLEFCRICPVREKASGSRSIDIVMPIPPPQVERPQAD